MMPHVYHYLTVEMLACGGELWKSLSWQMIINHGRQHLANHNFGLWMIGRYYEKAFQFAQPWCGR